MKNSKNKGVNKVQVSLKINGKTFKAKINSKGQVSFKITNLNRKGKFNGVIKFNANAYYKASSKKVKITIK